MKHWLAYTFSPFYARGRRWFGIAPWRLDRLIAAGLHASVTEYGVLTIGQVQYRAPKHMHRRAVAAWVRTFNDRAEAQT